MESWQIIAVVLGFLILIGLVALLLYFSLEDTSTGGATFQPLVQTTITRAGIPQANITGTSSGIETGVTTTMLTATVSPAPTPDDSQCTEPSLLTNTGE